MKPVSIPPPPPLTEDKDAWFRSLHQSLLELTTYWNQGIDANVMRPEAITDDMLSWPLLAPYGKVEAPSYTFKLSPKTGFYGMGLNHPALSINGTKIWDMVAGSLTLSQHLLFTDATYDIGASGATRPRHGYFSGNLVIGGLANIAGAVTMQSTLTVSGISTLSRTLISNNGAATLELSTATAGVFGLIQLSRSGVNKSYVGLTAADLFTVSNVFSVNPANGNGVFDGTLTVSGSQLIFGATNASIKAGPTSFTINNNANTVNNLYIADNGNTTIAGTLTVSGTGLSTFAGPIRLTAGGNGGGYVPTPDGITIGTGARNVMFLSDGSGTSVDGVIGAWNTVYNCQNSKIVFDKPSTNIGQILLYTQNGAGITLCATFRNDLATILAGTLTVSGVTKLSNLAGIGSRAVVASADGTLSAP